MADDRPIPLKYWSQILSKDSREQGAKFENLVEDLLKVKYDSLAWQATQATHDGKRDFFSSKPKFDDLEEGGSFDYWAECKCYTSNLSIDDIGSTILYAFLREPHVLLIFSYSPLNKNALSTIGSIKGKELDVKCFDGKLLDNELLKHDHILKKHFSVSQADLLPANSSKTAETYINISRDVLKYEFNDQISRRLIEGSEDIFLNETFALDISVRTLVDKATVFEIEIENLKEAVKYFDVLDIDFLKSGKKQVEVKLGQIGQYRLCFKLANAFKQTVFQIRIKIKTLDQDFWEVKKVKIRCIWLMRAPLLGQAHRYLTELIQPRIKNRHTQICFNIYGRSGVGKSRLLHEVTNELISRNIKIIDFQGQKNSVLPFREFFKEIVSKVEHLPLLKLKKTHSIVNSLHTMSFGRRVVYDDTFDFESDLEVCANYLENMAIPASLAIIIDNVQFLSEPILQFLNLLLIQRSSVSSILFFTCFNTDFVVPHTGNEAKSLFESLKIKSTDLRGDFLSLEISGFNTSQAEEYLYSILPDLENFPETSRKLLQASNQEVTDQEFISPLFLEQTLWHLKSNNVIKPDKSGVYFESIELFNQEIRKLPSNINQLFLVRVDFLREQERSSEYLRVLYLLFVFRDFPAHWINSFEIIPADLDYLIESGFVSKVHNLNYRLYHKQLEVFLDSVSFQASTDVLSKAIQFIELKGLQDQYAITYFLLEYDLLQANRQILSLPYVLDQYEKNCIDINVVLRVSDKVFNILMAENTSLNHKDEIKLFIGCCEYIKTYRSFRSAMSLYKKAYTKLLLLQEQYLNSGKGYFEFIHRFVNSYLSLHMDLEAQLLIKRSLQVIDKFEFPSEKVKETLLAKLLNRLCVTHKSLNAPHEAERVVQQSISIAKKYHNIELEIKNYVDYGYLYYKDKQKNELLFDTWNKAIHTFFDYKQEGKYDMVSSREVSIHFHASLVKLIKNEYEDCRKLVDEGLFYARRKFDKFNEIKLILVQSIVEVLDNPTYSSLNHAHKITLSALDKCIAHGSIRSYWVSFHLLAKIEWQLNDHKSSLNNYFKSLEQLRKLISDEGMEKRYLYFFDDLALHYKHSKKDIKPVLGLLFGRDIKERIKGISNMDQDDFIQFRDHFEPSTSITDGKSNFPMP